MNFITLTIVIISTSATISTIAIVVALSSYNQSKQANLAKEKLAKKFTKLKLHIDKVTQSMLAVGQRTLEIEYKIDQLDHKLMLAEKYSLTNSITAVNQPQKIAELGGSTDDLVANCGVTKAEARLIKLLAVE